MVFQCNHPIVEEVAVLHVSLSSDKEIMDMVANVQVNEMMDVEIIVENAENLYALSFKLIYDSSLIELYEEEPINIGNLFETPLYLL